MSLYVSHLLWCIPFISFSLDSVYSLSRALSLSFSPILSLCCQKDSVNILSTLHNTCDSIHLTLAYTCKAHNQPWKAAALNGFEASLHAACSTVCHHRLSHIQRMHCRHPSNRCVYVCLCVFLGLYGTLSCVSVEKKTTFAQIISHLPHCDVVSFFKATIFVMVLFEIIFFSCVIEISKENPHLYAHNKKKEPNAHKWI